jgi:Flp pilus assembly protein TadG
MLRRGYHLIGDRTGAAAVEFALVGPMLIFLMIGMVVYGSWFWLAQGVQTLASESARAALSGLDMAESHNLARAHVTNHAGRLMGVDPADVVVVVFTEADAIRVSVSYDASGHPLLAMAGLVPAPPSTIERSGVVRTGGW